MANNIIDMSKFNEYSRLRTVDDLISDKSLIGTVLGIRTATEALDYLKSHIKSNTFELRVHGESINLAIKELDNFKIAIQDAIKQKKKNANDKIMANKKEVERAKAHFDENVSPTFEALIDEVVKLSHIKGWGGTQTPTILRGMLNGIKDGIERNIANPSSLDMK